MLAIQPTDMVPERGQSEAFRVDPTFAKIPVRVQI
jgi:hypothetical protein